MRMLTHTCSANVFANDRNTRLPIDAMKRLEMKDFTWDRLFDLKPHELGELLRVPKLGKPVRLLVFSCSFKFSCDVAKEAVLRRVSDSDDTQNRDWEGSSTRSRH